MKLVVRLHPVLREQIRQLSNGAGQRRRFAQLLIRQAIAVVQRHGSEITYAPLAEAPHGDGAVGCAMSARTQRSGVVLIEVDPLGTATLKEVVRSRPVGLFHANGQRVLYHHQ